MRRRRIVSLLAAGATTALVAALGTGAASASPSTGPAAHRSAAVAASAQRQQDFAEAARATGVPQSVLMAVSYEESRWETHHGQPSMAGGYGPMHLTDVAGMPGNRDARGDLARPVPQSAGSVGSAETLPRAAALSHLPAATLKTDPAANLRAGAALLASDARRVNRGALPRSIDGWYAAVADYADARDTAGAQGFADLVYGVLRTGESLTTSDGQTLTLTAHPNLAPSRDVSALRLAAPAKVAGSAVPECPPTLDCNFVPAAYAQNSSDPGDYGDYDTANRPKDVRIDYIVLHDTEETFPDTIKTFQDPKSYVSAHYVIRSGDGHVTQMVATKDVAWQAGNWYINMHSVGIEQEGFAEEGGSWFTEALYEHSAALVRYLAHRFGVPLDRQHIIGHDNVPGISTDYIPGMHWDPAVYWDWAHYLALLGAPIRANGSARSSIVTIDPRFSTNNPTILSCDGTRRLPAQGGSDAVYLRTAPRFSAPLFTDPGLHYTDHKPGTRRICDWGDRAVAGQQFAVADRRPGWTAIWYAGSKVWFHNTASAPVTVPAQGYLVEPRHATAPVYGQALPAAKDWPKGVPPTTMTPLIYRLKKGQAYVLGGPTPTDYYYAKTIDSSLPHDHTDITGPERYYEIQLNHRIAFVNVRDVIVVPAD